MLTKLIAILSLTSVASFQSTVISHLQHARPTNLHGKTVKNDDIVDEILESTPFVKDDDSMYFKRGAAGGTNRPASVFILGSKYFVKNSKAIGLQGLARAGLVGDDYQNLPPQSLNLTLSSKAVKDAEMRREATEGRVETNAVARALYDVGCFVLDELFPDRPIARFWFLETIARIPYFAYVSMLHLYESFGWWRSIQLRKVHNAEEYNELHHLL